MNPLTIEIHGTGTHNRGAELMAIAIAEWMRANFPEARLAVPARFGTFEDRMRHGFFLVEDFDGGIRSKVCATLASPHFRRCVGLISGHEVDAVLDASGFAFSDQWGPRRARNLIRKMEKRSRRHQPLVLLPQAFGPFENPEVARLSRQLFARASLVCARDDRSFEAVQRLGANRTLCRYPDFTLSVIPKHARELALSDRFAAIVPNIHMLGKTDKGEDYLAFLRRALKCLHRQGLQPVFVLHDVEEDRQVIKAVNEESLPVIEHSDPAVLKSVLGRASLVIGSRFHALVSTLSQNIPCIGAGWSHKYIELFRDFDVPDLLVEDLSDHQRLEMLIRELSDESCRKERMARLSVATARLKEQTVLMWERVEAVLRDGLASRRSDQAAGIAPPAKRAAG
jgi:polysaccharide pyruvyl transferase WcaK-like protein